MRPGTPTSPRRWHQRAFERIAGAPPHHRLDWLVLPTWLVTRGLVLALVFGISRGDVARMQDVGYYLEVARHIADTRRMPMTELWQYPPGAALVLVLPLLVGVAGYGIAFVVMMAACDAGVTWLLHRAGRANGSRLGVWAWLLAMPWLREYPMLRFDVVPTMFAVAALLYVARRPLIFGALTGAGAVVKAWPIVVLAAEWNLRRLAIAFVAAAVVVVVGVGIARETLGPQGGVLDNQAGRGLQAEAVAASPWHVDAILDGRLATLRYGSGALEIADRRADSVVEALESAMFVATGLLAAWWSARQLLLRRDPLRYEHLATSAMAVDLVFTGVLLAMVTSRVLSPQFMVWSLGVAAVCLTFPRTRMRLPVALVLAATILTFGVLRFPEALVARNALLVVASAAALIQLVRALRPAVEPVDDVDVPSSRQAPEPLLPA